MIKRISWCIAQKYKHQIKLAVFLGCKVPRKLSFKTRKAGLNSWNFALMKYCRVPARRGLQRTALAPGSDETRTRDPLVRQQVD